MVGQSGPGNSKRTPHVFYSPAGPSISATYYCFTCKLYFDNAGNNDFTFFEHLRIEHGFSDGG